MLPVKNLPSFYPGTNNLIVIVDDRRIKIFADTQFALGIQGVDVLLLRVYAEFSIVWDCSEMPRNKGFCGVCRPLKCGILKDFHATFGIFKRQISDKF